MPQSRLTISLPRHLLRAIHLSRRPVLRDVRDYFFAFHEAGHTVAAAALGIGVFETSIEPSEEYLGYCKHQRERTSDWFLMSTRDRQVWIEKQLIINFSGMATDALINRLPVRLFRRKYYSGDLRNAAGYAMMWRNWPHFQEMDFNEAEAFWTDHPDLEARAFRRATKLIREHRAAVDAVASALLPEKTLYIGQIRDVLTPWFG